MEETVAMSTDEDNPDVAEYVRRHAPEFDEKEVVAFMNEHDKPEHEKGFHVEWAVRALRERREDEQRDGPSVDQIVHEMRRHNAR
jgi:hypothetical protein